MVDIELTRLPNKPKQHSEGTIIPATNKMNPTIHIITPIIPTTIPTIAKTSPDLVGGDDRVSCSAVKPQTIPTILAIIGIRNKPIIEEQQLTIARVLVGN
jgi:hypothetical protein